MDHGSFWCTKIDVFFLVPSHAILQEHILLDGNWSWMVLLFAFFLKDFFVDVFCSICSICIVLVKRNLLLCVLSPLCLRDIWPSVDNNRDSRTWEKFRLTDRRWSIDINKDKQRQPDSLFPFLLHHYWHFCPMLIESHAIVPFETLVFMLTMLFEFSLRSSV